MYNNTLPATKAFAITKSDTVDLSSQTRGIGVNVSGNVKLLFSGNTEAVTVYMISGIVYPFVVKRVYSTGTDAVVSGIVGYL